MDCTSRCLHHYVPDGGGRHEMGKIPKDSIHVVIHKEERLGNVLNRYLSSFHSFHAKPRPRDFIHVLHVVAHCWNAILSQSPIREECDGAEAQMEEETGCSNYESQGKDVKSRKDRGSPDRIHSHW